MWQLLLTTGRAGRYSCHPVSRQTLLVPPAKLRLLALTYRQVSIGEVSIVYTEVMSRSTFAGYMPMQQQARHRIRRSVDQVTPGSGVPAVRFTESSNSLHSLEKRREVAVEISAAERSFTLPQIGTDERAWGSPRGVAIPLPCTGSG